MFLYLYLNKLFNACSVNPVLVLNDTDMVVFLISIVHAFDFFAGILLTIITICGIAGSILINTCAFLEEILTGLIAGPAESSAEEVVGFGRREENVQESERVITDTQAHTDITDSNFIISVKTGLPHCFPEGQVEDPERGR